LAFSQPLTSAANASSLSAPKSAIRLLEKGFVSVLQPNLLLAMARATRFEHLFD
jgi:hypothetical protein